MDASAARPVPTVADYARPYWEGLPERRLMLQRCASCGRTQFYPRLACRHCRRRDLEWVESAGLGEVYSFSVVARSPGPFAADVPYVVALVDLDEGARLATRVVGTDPAAVRIGLRVRVEYTDFDGVVLPVFRPVERTAASPS